jgi:hypothetical protein
MKRRGWGFWLGRFQLAKELCSTRIQETHLGNEDSEGNFGLFDSNGNKILSITDQIAGDIYSVPLIWAWF